MKQDSPGTQELSSLKSHKIQPSPPKKNPGMCYKTKNNGFLIKFYIGGETVKNVQIDPQTTEIWPKHFNVTLSVSD